jgi:cobalt-zinc-cadmium efflux system membrane fusion protein
MRRFSWLALALAAGCSSQATEPPAPQSPAGEAWLSAQQIADAKIVVAPVGDQDVGGAIVASGKVTFDDLRVSHVFSPVTGRITKILANPGQRVKKGQPLAVIASPDIGTAFADLEKAQAAFNAAERDLKRQKELFAEHAASQKDYETAQNNYGNTKAELDRAQHKARLLRAGNVNTTMSEYTLTAQIDGEVISRSTNLGVEVQGTYGGGQSPELFTVGELDKVWVLADVFEMDLALVKKGARVSVKVVAYPNKVFEGHVDWVSGSLDANSRTAKVRCSIDNPLHDNGPQRELKPEMYATVSVSVAERKALAIPRNALLRLGDQTVVFVEKGKTKDGQLRFERRPVAVDEEEGGDYLPVTHGLEAGERIVTSGGILLLGLL